jgi:RNA polymerase sigma-70 factor (ECF subfamily)
MPLDRDDSRARFEAAALPLMGALHRTAFRLTRSREDAADVVQETFLRAYRTFSNFAPGTNSKAWLFTIMYSVFVNRYRKAKREPLPVSLEEVEERFQRSMTAEWVSDPHAWDVRGEWPRTEAGRALDRLPESFRSAVVLVDLEELSYEEAAAVLSCPVGTLRSRLFRGRKLLFLELQDYGRKMGYLRVRET